MNKRIEWIDIWKGIGIIAVVTGHIIQPPFKHYIYWFHMPLFFFISGYLYRPNSDYLNFFKKKSIIFFVPYFFFLFLLSIPEYILTYLYSNDPNIGKILVKMTIYKILGGAYIYGWFDVFWFITCLFFTQQLYNFIFCQFNSNQKFNFKIFAIIISAYFLAIIDSYFFTNLKLPWAINIVLFALPFYFFGHFYSQFNMINKKFLIICFVPVILAIIFYDQMPFDLNLDLKKKQYGIILINLILPITMIIISQYLAILFSKFNLPNLLFSKIGEASLIIMYLHQFFNSFVKDFSFFISIKILICVICPYFCYLIFRRFHITRKIFLGDFKT